MEKSLLLLYSKIIADKEVKTEKIDKIKFAVFKALSQKNNTADTDAARLKTINTSFQSRILVLTTPFSLEGCLSQAIKETNAITAVTHK